MLCPKCGHDQHETNQECAKCGVIFSKINPESDVDEIEPERGRSPWMKYAAAAGLLIIGLIGWIAFGGRPTTEPVLESATKVDRPNSPEATVQASAIREEKPSFSTIKLKALLIRTISDMEKMKAWELNEYTKELISESEGLTASSNIPPQEKKALLEKAAVQLEIVKPIVRKKDLQEKMDAITAEYDQKRRQVELETEMKVFKIHTEALRKSMDNP